MALLGPTTVLAPETGRLAFAPEEGSRVTKTFEIAADFALDDLSLVVNGEDIGAMIGGLDLSGETLTAVSVTDVYGKTKNGRPLGLVRTFDSLSGSFEVSVMTEWGGEDQDVQSTSELEGATVRFDWNDDADEYEVAFDEKGGDEDLLEGLVEDMDLRAFLPPADVEEGDTWQVDLEALSTVIAPGGDLVLLPDDAEMDLDEMKELEDLFSGQFDDFGELLEGECTCVLSGIREEDGRKLAEIDIDLEVRADIDLSDMILQALELIGEELGEEAPEIDLETADLSIEIDGTGVLLWDLEAGRASSLDLTGEAIFSIDLSVSAEMDGEGGSAEFYAELSGQYRETVTIGE